MHNEYVHYIKKQFSIDLPPFEILKAQTGGMVGTVEIIDCTRDHASRWKDPGSWAFVLARPEPCTLIPYRGQLGFFEPGRELTPPTS